MTSRRPSSVNRRLRAAILAVNLTCATAGIGQDAGRPASPIFGVTVPDEYRSWPLVAPALEGEPLNELRAVVGNDIAVKAYETGTLPFPDGAILVKLAWLHVPSPDFEPATVPGMATTVQIMVKDSRRFPDTGGWGFGRFIGGRPVDASQHRSCFACHQARVKERDFVFTRYAN